MVLGVQTIKFVEKELRLLISARYMWTDSLCVFDWLKSSKPLKVWVDDRIKEIRKAKDITFRYIPSLENPADLATKGKLTNMNWELWWNGPKWLRQDFSFWPLLRRPEMSSSELQEIETEYKNVKYTFSLFTGEISQGFQCPKLQEIVDVGKFSSLIPLLRHTAWIIRIVEKFKSYKKTQGKGNSLSPLDGKEIKEAKRLWDISIQREIFFEALKDGKGNLIKQLKVFEGEDKILRCQGRLGNSELPEEVKYPKLLPKGHPYTSLVILHFHKNCFHAGTSHTLNALRQEYWVIHGRTTVRSAILRCGECRRYFAKPYKVPEMAPLPTERVSVMHPFSHTGIDYCGPFYCRETGKDPYTKVWVCLFTCTRIRAIHLEVTTDMSAKGFLLALRRFIARRGKPKEIISDNALQFLLAEKVLEKANKEAVQRELSSHGIYWNYIPIASPWMGGFYERMIGIVKSALRKTIKKKSLSQDQFYTILTEIENSVNSRPLCYVSGDIEDPEILTPRHFLTVNPISDLPILESELDDPDYIPKPSNVTQILESWKRGQHLLQRFWESWSREYLIYLKHDRHPHETMKSGKITSQFIPKVGEVVLICDRNQPRNLWNLGIIQSIYRGDDGEIRSCEIRHPNQKYSIRAIKNLYPLEVTPDAEVKKVNEAESSVVTSHTFLNTYSPFVPPVVRQLAMRSGHYSKSESGRRPVQMAFQEMDVEAILNGDQDRNSAEHLLTFEENENLGDANLLRNPLSPQSENFILYGNQQPPPSNEPNFESNQVNADALGAPDSIEMQNTLEKMTSMESYIASLEKEIGELKEKKDPTDQLLHKTSHRRNEGGFHGGREFPQGGENHGIDGTYRGMDFGRGGNRGKLGDGRGGSGQSRGRGGNPDGRGGSGQNRGRGGGNGQSRGRGGNRGRGGGLRFNYFNAGRKSSIQVSPQDQSVYVNFTTQQPRYGHHNRNGKDFRTHQDHDKATSSGGGMSRQADNN